jgi:hypothetical protein
MQQACRCDANNVTEVGIRQLSVDLNQSCVFTAA